MTRVTLFGNSGGRKSLEPSPLIFGGSGLSGFQFTEPSVVASGADASPSPAPRSTASIWTPSTTSDTDTGNDVAWATVLSATPAPTIGRSRSPLGRARTVSSTGSPLPPGAPVNQSRRPFVDPDVLISSFNSGGSTPAGRPGPSVSQSKSPAIDPDRPILSVESRGSTPVRGPEPSANHSRRPLIDPGTSIPSVDSRGSTPPEWPGTRRSGSNAPSIFFSPAPSAQLCAPATPTSAGRPREQSSASIASGPGSLSPDLSDTPLAMASLAAAIDDVATGKDASRRYVIGPLGVHSPQPMLIRGQSPGSPCSPAQKEHDVRDEELPSHKFHSPEVQQALVDAKRVMGSLAVVLGNRGLFARPAPTLLGYTMKAKQLADFEVQATRMVGLLGVSGVGKSKLLNSLLDLNTMARTSNLGSACTCVATEYHYRKENNFAIAIELFSLDEMKAQITNLLTYYRLRYRVDGRSDEPEDELEKKASVAKSTLQAVFREKSPSKEFLCQDSLEEVTGILLGWLAGLYPTDVDERPREFLTQDECSAELERLTSQMDVPPDASSQQIAWPFIRQVKVFVKAHILSNGLILADLPGLQDVNNARVAVTERHLQRCDEIFAVAKIDRAVTDSSVANIFEYASANSLLKVGIVCTNAEVIDPDEARREWTGKTEGEIIQHLHEQVLLLEQMLQAAEPQLRGDEVDVKLVNDYLSIKRQKSAAQLKLTKFLIETRRDMVSLQLRKEYGRKVAVGAVDVFCVGNKMYEDWRRKKGAIDYLNLSGIISLRRHCLGLTADSQLSSLAELITADIPRLLGDLELWVKSGAETAEAEQKRAAIEALDKSEERLREAFRSDDSPIQLLEVSMDDMWDEQVYQVCQTESWSMAAIEASKSWRILHDGTYGAFCRKFGVHKYETGGDVVFGNWNEQIMKKTGDDVREIWSPFVSALNGYLDAAIQKVEDALPDATRDAALFCALVAIDRWRGLREAVGGHKKKLRQETKKLRAKFQSELESLRTSAFTGIPGSIIVELLTPTYTVCGEDGGTRVHDRRKRLMEEAVADPQLFTSLMDRVDDGFQALTKELQRDVDSAVESLVEGICQTMDLIRRDNAARESEWDPAFRGRVERQVAEARREVERFQTLF